MLLKWLYVIIIVFFLVSLCINVIKRKDTLLQEPGSVVYYSFYSFLIYCLAAFGISDSALNTMLFRKKKYVSIENLPGTIVICAVTPFCSLSYSYIPSITIKTHTILMFAAASALGSFFGASIVAKCSKKTIRKLLIIALLLSIVMLLVKILLPAEIGVSSVKFNTGETVLAVLSVLLMMAFAMVGLSTAAPMAAVFMLMGMDTISSIALSIIVASFGCIIGAIKYMWTKKFSLKAALCENPFGLLGGLVGVRLIHYVPEILIQILMLSAVCFAAIILIKDKPVEALERRAVCYEQRDNH